MIYVNILAGAFILFCFYKGLRDNQYIEASIILKKIAITATIIMVVFISDGLLFYYINNLPLISFSINEYVNLYSDSLSAIQKAELYGPYFLIIIGSIYFLFEYKTHSKFKTLYGNAHFATPKEVQKMGLLNGEGNLIVGDFKGKLLKYTITNHMLMFAPSRSGKGVSTVIPNALNWQDSLLCTDNKFEIYEYTSGYRKKCGHEVYRFSPASVERKTHCINPLDYIDRHDPCRRIQDIQLILDILIQHSGDENKMWAEEARSLATGLLLWLSKQNDRPFALSELAAMVKGGNLDEFLRKVIDECVIADNLITIDHAAYIAIQNFLQKADKEQSGVRSTLTGMLRLWEDPMVCAATNKSDFDLRDFRKKKITLYLSFGTNHLSRFAPLINLLIQLFLDLMLAKLPKEDEPHKVLCLIDEMNRFGRMDKLKDAFGDAAGYGIHLLPIIQNLGQFYENYGGQDSSEIFFQNTSLKICFRQSSERDKTYISNSLGTKTVKVTTRSYASDKSGTNWSESYESRPLLTELEVQEFPKNEQLVITNDGVVRCNKIKYYTDKRFKHKILDASYVPTQTPYYPVIDIRKESTTVSQETVLKKEAEKVQKQQERVKAQEIGKAVFDVLQPLINKASDAVSTKTPQYIDKATGEIFSDLADTFEE